MMKTVKLRTVAGRPIEVDIEEGEAMTVKDVVRKVCSCYGYAVKGSRLVVRGVTLQEDGEVSELEKTGVAPTFIGVKSPYGKVETVASSPTGHKTPSRERITDVDLTLPEFDGPFDIQHRQGIVQLEHALGRISESEVMSLLVIHPTVTHLRVLVQENPSLLAPALHQINAIAPGIIDMVTKQMEAFLKLLNESVPSSGRWEHKDDDELVDFSTLEAELCQEEVEALNRIQDLGPFSRELVLHTFMEAGRNEHLAAQYLMESYEPIASYTQTQAETEIDVIRARLESATDSLLVMDCLTQLGDALLRQSDGSYEDVLMKALSIAYDTLEEYPEESAACHAHAVRTLKTQLSDDPSKLVVLIEAERLMELATEGVRLQSSTMDALTNIVKKEGVDVVQVHLDNDSRLTICHISHNEVPVIRRSALLTEGEVGLLTTAGEELATLLAGSTPSRVWGLLNGLYKTIFGVSGCGDWLPTRVCFASSLRIPFHALAAHGSVPLGRGREVSQVASITYLGALQDLSGTVAGRRKPLRSVFYGNAAGQASADKINPSDLRTDEPVAIAHFGPNTSGGVQTVRTESSKTDVAVFTAGLLDSPLTPHLSGGSAPWCCSAVVNILPVKRSTPAARPSNKDGNVFIQNVHRQLGRHGVSKIDAYTAAVTPQDGSHPGSWVPWVFSGTRLQLGGRRAHIRSEKLRATDDYRYLESHSMHIVFDQMIGHLLGDKPTEPLDSLLSFMEAKRTDLESLGKKAE
eukprot:TRINITY_DN3927_c0_g1_i1.p1 TRINITY_DN3927_c0_g1~~TRINITY_DN3927_c0_g1_i1.p1  ORF type:complete len:748 (+),score=106.82 TRINITY_DN3927_c0_g1_i1:81-2324(+)